MLLFWTKRNILAALSFVDWKYVQYKNMGWTAGEWSGDALWMIRRTRRRRTCRRRRRRQNGEVIIILCNNEMLFLLMISRMELRRSRSVDERTDCNWVSSSVKWLNKVVVRRSMERRRRRKFYSRQRSPRPVMKSELGADRQRQWTEIAFRSMLGM